MMSYPRSGRRILQPFQFGKEDQLLSEKTTKSRPAAPQHLLWPEHNLAEKTGPAPGQFPVPFFGRSLPYFHNNDMLKHAACLRGQGRNDSPKPAPVYACKYVLPGQARSRLQIRLGARLCTREHPASFSMSLRGAGRPPRDVAIRIPPGKPTKLTAVQANS